MISPVKLISVIIPVYNEQASVGLLLKKIDQVNFINDIQKQIIIIDDASNDETEEIVKSLIPTLKNGTFISERLKKNSGKGAAIQRGIELAEGDYLVVQDADMEYDPEEINYLLDPVIKVGADVVYGSRFMGHFPHRVLFFWHSLGNKFLTMLSNAFTNLNLTDMETCYKLIRTDLIKSIKLKEKRFGFEPEVTAKLSKIPEIKFYEVGISYYGRTYANGKKIGWKDGVRAIYCIVRYNLFG